MLSKLICVALLAASGLHAQGISTLTGATGAAGPNGLNNTPGGTLTAANFNSTADQPITITLPTGYTRYVVRRVTVSTYVPAPM